MRLLVINFEMDTHSRAMPWSAEVVNRLAASCEKVIVLTSRVGRYQAPPNVVVATFPFPRLIAVPPLRFLLAFMANVKAFFLLRRHPVDACFVHMAAYWVSYLSPVLKIKKLPSLVWYAHGTVTDELRRVLKSADRIITSTPEGFRLPSPKVHVIGQGVDTDLFRSLKSSRERTDIVSVNRMTPRKQIEILIEAMRIVKERPNAPRVRLRLVGGPIARSDKDYEQRMRDLAKQYNLTDVVEFVGFVPNAEIPKMYETAFLHLNVSRTGSMDKTVLEALACGCPVLTSNEAFGEMLKNRPEFILKDESPHAIADAIVTAYEKRKNLDLDAQRALVVGRHDMNSYVGKILNQLREMTAGKKAL